MRANSGISDKKFGLPTVDEFRKAEADGIREALPNMRDHFFWSASLYPYVSDFARVFSGYDGYSYVDFRDNGGYSVRCVGR